MSLMRSVHDWDPSDSDAALPPAAIAEAQKREDEDHHEKAYMTVSQVSFFFSFSLSLSRGVFFLVEGEQRGRERRVWTFGRSLTDFLFRFRLPFLSRPPTRNTPLLPRLLYSPYPYPPLHFAFRPASPTLARFVSPSPPSHPSLSSLVSSRYISRTHRHPTPFNPYIYPSFSLSQS